MSTHKIMDAYKNYQATFHTFLTGDKKVALDKAALKVYETLKSVKLTTPFLRHLVIDFTPEVFALRHKIITQDKQEHPEHINEMVIELIRLSNKYARNHDYTSYKQAIFELDNLDETRIKSGLAQLIKIDESKRNALVHKHAITNETFFEKLHSIGPKPKHHDKWRLLNTLVKRFEYDNFQQTIIFEDANTFEDSETILDTKGNIIVRTPTINTMFDLKLFLHKLSKALIIFYHQSDSKNIFLRPTKLTALSTMVESLLIQIVCTKTESKFLQHLTILENSYFAGHALFEFDLHQDGNSAKKIYTDLMNPLYRVDVVEHWGQALLINRQLLSMHYRPIGYIMAQNLKIILNKERVNKRKLGIWLKDNILTRIDEVGMDALI